MPLIALATAVLLALRGIRIVTVRGISTTTMSIMSIVAQLTGMAAHHCNVATTVREIAAIARNTRMMTMGGWV